LERKLVLSILDVEDVEEGVIMWERRNAPIVVIQILNGENFPGKLNWEQGKEVVNYSFNISISLSKFLISLSISFLISLLNSFLSIWIFSEFFS